MGRGESELIVTNSLQWSHLPLGFSMPFLGQVCPLLAKEPLLQAGDAVDQHRVLLMSKCAERDRDSDTPDLCIPSLQPLLYPSPSLTDTLFTFYLVLTHLNGGGGGDMVGTREGDHSCGSVEVDECSTDMRNTDPTLGEGGRREVVVPWGRGRTGGVGSSSKRSSTQG